MHIISLTFHCCFCQCYITYVVFIQLTYVFMPSIQYLLSPVQFDVAISVLNACSYTCILLSVSYLSNLSMHLLRLVCGVEVLNHLTLFNKHISFAWLTIISASSLLYSSTFDFAFLLSYILIIMACIIYFCLPFTSILGYVPYWVYQYSDESIVAIF